MSLAVTQALLFARAQAQDQRVGRHECLIILGGIEKHWTPTRQTLHSLKARPVIVNQLTVL